MSAALAFTALAFAFGGFALFTTFAFAALAFAALAFALFTTFAFGALVFAIFTTFAFAALAFATPAFAVLALAMLAFATFAFGTLVFAFSGFAFTLFAAFAFAALALIFGGLVLGVSAALALVTVRAGVDPLGRQLGQAERIIGGDGARTRQRTCDSQGQSDGADIFLVHDLTPLKGKQKLPEPDCSRRHDPKQRRELE